MRTASAGVTEASTCPMVGGCGAPSGWRPCDSGSRASMAAAANRMTRPTLIMMVRAVRHPWAAIRVAAMGGPTMLPKEPPEVTMALAIPRRATNQRTAVAFTGTHEQLMPTGATTARASATAHRLWAPAHRA